jgi:hypothetical protein
MSTFPRSETQIVALSQLVAEGLGKMAEDFPSPPVPATELQNRLSAYSAALSGTIEADMTSQRQHAAKDEALTEIVDGVKADIKYAEALARKNPEKLAGIGWGRRRDRTPLEPPGEVRDIALGNQGDTWVALKWNPPVNGGLTAAYQIQRKNGTGAWEDAGISMTTERLMLDQPRGVELSFRVIATNKAGAGQPSGVVTAVL